jgi:Fur family iron response transcriptional regulator
MDVVAILTSHGIQPSPQRVAVAGYVLRTDSHPSADEVLAHVRAVLARVRSDAPTLSRATVYNTLHLLVEKGLLRELAITGDRVVFDPRLEPHHHFVDDDTGAVSDIPFDAFAVEQRGALPDLQVRDVEVVVRGRRR